MKIMAACVIAACLSGCATGHWVNTKNPDANWHQDDSGCRYEAKAATASIESGNMNSPNPSNRQIDLWKRCIALKGWWWSKRPASGPVVAPPGYARAHEPMVGGFKSSSPAQEIKDLTGGS